MDHTKLQKEEPLDFFATAPKPCGYLPNREAVSIFADPDAQLSASLYNHLARFGFRRSGSNIYVPSCPGCSECIPVRIPVQQFKRSRNQQKLWNRNQDLVQEALPPRFREEHFQLYRQYLASRHPGGGMDQPTRDEYLDFLTSRWSETVFVELRHQDELVAVAVTDVLDDALSSVYTFFSPELSRRSLGTFSILQQVQLAREAGAEWLYLGYWISGSEKMRYKGRFRPLEAYRKGRWESL